MITASIKMKGMSMMAITKRIYGMAAGILMAAALTGCGDGTDEVMSESSISVEIGRAHV